MAYYGRGKNRIKDQVTLTVMYKDYIKDIDESSPYWISYTEYRSICEDYFKLIAAEILSAVAFKLPFGLGILKIVKYKSSMKCRLQPIDWKTTSLVKKLVTNYNRHSDGYRYKMFWSKPSNVVANIECYQFILARANKRKEAYLIKNKQIDYFEQK